MFSAKFKNSDFTTEIEAVNIPIRWAVLKLTNYFQGELIIAWDAGKLDRELFTSSAGDVRAKVANWEILAALAYILGLRVSIITDTAATTVDISQID